MLTEELLPARVQLEGDAGKPAGEDRWMRRMHPEARAARKFIGVAGF